MAFVIHLALLSEILITTIVAVAWGRGGAPRSVRAVFGIVIPFLILGIACALLMSATGAPVIEWAFPALAVLIIGLSRPSDRVFTWLPRVIFLAALVLCVNFTHLVHGEFTAAPGFSRAINNSQQRSVLGAAGAALRSRFPAQEVLPKQPLVKLIPDARLTSVEIDSVEREWHTPVTRLYRVHRAEGTLWYPGGPIEVASQQLVIRKDQ